MTIAKPRPSLKGRALRWLAQREHSRAELRDKLRRAVEQDRRRAAARAAAEQPVGSSPGPLPCVVAESAHDEARFDAELEALLDELAGHGLLCDERFIASRVRLRAGRHGTERIRQELARHGLKLDAEQRDALQASEFERAREVWRRRFGVPAQAPSERARQARFLSARGFAADVVRRVVGGRDADFDS